MFFGMGPGEIMIILVVALVVFGPDKLPQVARQVGQAVRDFRRMTAEMTAEFQEVTQELTGDLRDAAREIQDELRGVQSDLTNELRDVNEALRLEGGVAAPGQALAAPGTYAGDGGGIATSYQAATTVAEPPATNGSAPMTATKTDPRLDVSWLDLEELVVMPRTERPANGRPATNGAAPAAAPPAAARQPRSGRRAATTYARPPLRGR